MKASATKERAKPSGPSQSYLKTRVRASRLLAAAHVLAIVELTRRLHQAYRFAYDKQAADWVLPQNTGHEAAHSTVRCPPTGKQLAANPTVKKTINEAFKRADQFRKERGYWVEHGGWIYQNRKTGRIATFIKTPDASPPLPRDYPYLDSGYRVFLNSPPTMPGFNIVGDFHLHGENGGPNEYDDAVADAHKAPGVLGTPDGKTYAVGNIQRGIFGQGTPANCR